MNRIKYLIKNKKQIEQSAAFINKNHPKIEFLKLANHFIFGIKTNNKEALTKINENYDISSYLQNHRNLDHEEFYIYLVFNDGMLKIFQSKGTATSSLINLNDIDRVIINFYIQRGLNNFNLFIVHNHPFVYKATPSKADFETLEGLNEDFVCLKQNLNISINIIDFSIVTISDYWSLYQNMENI